MRTNIDIDEKLMAEAMSAAGTATKKDTVREALELLVRLRRGQTAIRALRGKIEILVEILQGLREGPQLRLVEALLRAFRVVPLCGSAIAPKAAANYRLLRRAGVTPRGTIDVIIATWCIENDVSLLHNDRDFLVMEQRLGLVAWG